MLAVLEMTCVQVVFVKIMTVAYPTVTSEVNKIRVFCPWFCELFLFKVFHIFSWFQVSGILQEPGVSVQVSELIRAVAQIGLLLLISP
jgi:hypothetical protein